MQTNLAWRNLTYRKGRTLVTMAGISFPILLIFAQLGFLGAVGETATLVFDQLEADIFLISPGYLNISKPGVLPRSRLYQADSIAGVERTAPLYLGLRRYRNPVSRHRRLIMVLGFDPTKPTFKIPEVGLRLEQLKLPDTVLIDRKTRPEFGPRDTGVQTEVEGRRIEIVGQFTMGMGFAAHGALIVSDLNFSRILKRDTTDEVGLGLISLTPESDPESVARTLKARLPDDVQVLTRREMRELERDYWFASTPVGVIFGIGVAVAFVIGFLILYQVLAADIARRYPEYATLKALGYSGWQLSQIVLSQAWILALASYVPAFVIALGFYHLTTTAANVPVQMEWGRAVGVLGMAILMSSGSALLALRRVRLMDPAELF